MYLPGKKYKCISFSLVFIIGFVAIAGAVFSAPVCVYALSLGGLKGTIASLIISLFLQSGVAPVNNTWINQLNNAYGVESSIGTIEDMISSGLLTESGGTLIDTGLSNAIASVPEYTSLGIDDIFTTVAGESGVIANSGAVNLANSAINVGTAGTIGAFAGAVAIGVGVGILADHIQQKYINPIRLGLYMDTIDPAFNLNNVSSYMRIVYTSNYAGYPIRWVDSAGDENVYFAHGDTAGYVLNTSGSNISDFVKAINQGNASWSDISLSVANNAVTTIPTSRYAGGPYKFSGGASFGTNQEATNYLNGIKNGTIQPKNPYSPDLIGQNGNLNAQEDQSNPNIYNVPEIRNIVPDGYDMTPVDMDDYRDYVDQANDNTDNDDIGQEIQGQDFQDFVNPYFVPQPNEPDTPIIPENPGDVPTYPDRPVEPEQPNIPPKTDVTDGDIQQSLEGATTIDLRSVFPFCIPWDIYNLVLIFDTGENREAPHIIFTFPFNENWVIDVDFAEYDDVAGILRLLELILFIMGLMVATRRLIGARG